MIPVPISAPDGSTLLGFDNAFFALFPFLDGAVSNCDDAHIRQEAGRLLAQYHNVVWSYRPEPLIRPGVGRIDNLDWITTNSGSVRALLTRCVEDEPGIRAMCDAVENEIGETTASLRRVAAECPTAVIHHDLGPQNLLIRGHEIIGLLDFDLASWDLRAFDVATAIMWFAAANLRVTARFEGYEWRYRRPVALDFLRGYASTTQYPLSELEYQILPALMRMFCIWLILWHLDRRLVGENWLSEDIDGVFSVLSDMRESKRAEYYLLSAGML